MNSAELLSRIKKAARNKVANLDLANSGIEVLPPEIGRLTQLRTLILTDNQLKTLPPEIWQLTQLRNLHLDDNQLKTLPPEIGRLTQLRRLDVHSNQLKTLPLEIGQLTQLTYLDMWGNEFSSFPQAVLGCTQLEDLDLSYNELETMPPEISRLTQLTELDYSHNGLKSLPPEIGRLSALEILLLYENRLTSLPPEIGQLTELITLGVENNQLSSLPPEIGLLVNVRTICIDDQANNSLTTLPAELGRLKALQLLSVDKLALSNPPPEIVEQGTAAILSFLRELLPVEPVQGEIVKGSVTLRSKPVWESKLLVVGEGGVGKTQLLRALCNEKFQAGPESETTWGIDISPMNLPHPKHDDIHMLLKCWDFGGQNIYHATHQFFLTTRSLFLLVWNARLGWEQGRLHYWLDTIKALAPDAPVMLVATHIDQRSAALPLEDLAKKYQQIVGEWSVSNVKRDLNDKGIDKLRVDLALHAAALPLMGHPWPDSYREATKTIRSIEEKHITTLRLYEIMKNSGVSRRSWPVLAEQLHHLGEILYFEKDKLLSDTVFLDPGWVTKRISEVLVHTGIVDGLGIFTREHMEACWSDLNKQLQDDLLRLMEQFDLSYEIPDDPLDRSLVVERLSLDPVPYEDNWNSLKTEDGLHEIRMKFHLQSTRPAGIPGWFIARSHRFTTHTHWKYGALFQDNRLKVSDGIWPC